MSHSNFTGRARLSVTPLESRLVPSGAGGLVVTDSSGVYAVGSRSGAGTAAVYAADGTLSYEVTPFGADFAGGVRVALADVTGDNVLDLVAGAGKGTTAKVVVYDGSTHAQVAAFTAYEAAFTGGVYVAAADLTGDGRAEIVTGADEGGGPRVRVFDGATVAAAADPAVLADFLAINAPNFRGGVRLALGDIGGDGVADLLVGAGFGGGPRVAAYDGAALADGQVVALFPDFFAYEPGLRNGVFPAVGDLNGDGCGELVLGAGPGGAPRVRALNGRRAVRGESAELANFFAGDTANRAGVQVGVTTTDGVTSIVGTDLAAGTANLFGTDSRGRGDAGGRGRGHGQSGGAAFVGSPYTVAAAAALAASVVGTYTGTGAGTLTTLTGTGSDLPGVVADATVTLPITSATPILPDGVDPTAAGTATQRLRGLTLTGTITVTTDAGTLDLPVTGALRLSRGRSDSAATAAARGTVVLVTDRTADAAAADGTGVALTGSLVGGELTASRFIASDRTAAAGGTIFQSPAARAAARLVLTRA